MDPVTLRVEAILGEAFADAYGLNNERDDDEELEHDLEPDHGEDDE